MPSLNLTWSEANKCWVKSLGYHFNDRGDRVPRYFRFAYSNDEKGKKQAQEELIPIVAEWQKIKQKGKAEGNKYPVWHNPKLQSPGSVPLGQRSGLIMVNQAIEENEKANPVKQLSESTILQVKEAFIAEVDATTSGSRTKQTARECLLSALKPINVELPMMKFDRQLMEHLVKTNVELIQSEKRRGRTAKNYCMAVKRLIKWYAKKVDDYHLPKDFDDIFSAEYFRPPADDNDDFTEDGEEKNFEVYTPSDIRTVFECCNDDEERLVVLMAVNAGCYFVDVAHTIKARNVYLDRTPPFLLYKRHKEKRFTPLIQKVYLWDETAQVVARLLNRGNEYSYAFLTAEGRPHDMKSIRRIWRRVYKKAIKRLTHRRSVKFIDLRKTGGSAISNFSSIDLGELFLGHRIPTMGKLYIKLAKTRLKTPTYKWYRQLKDAGVFDSFPK